MNIDKVTLHDLSIFHSEEDQSIFHKLNQTRTSLGRDWLHRFFKEPFDNVSAIEQQQQILQHLTKFLDDWPQQISNGTIMVMVRFFDAQLEPIPPAHSFLGGLRYKLMASPDFATVRYSMGHFADFVRGFLRLIELLRATQLPKPLQQLLDRAAGLLNETTIRALGAHLSGTSFTLQEVVGFGHFIFYRYKQQVHELLQLFGKLDAWYGMAKAAVVFNLQYPKVIDTSTPVLEARQLYHLLLPQPVAYDIDLNKQHNFLFLTGANMAGKSTFIRSIGAAIYLAHLGMGVPAASMTCSLFEGILSNINVTDNIARGESFFFNEVQRIRNTILKINDGNKWLVLIDELFKGTNIKDAMKCSLAVIEGLVKMRQSIFVLSTHLYEIGEELRNHQNIQFSYFETEIEDDQLVFNYHLRPGISNDRIGYLILKREKVLELLDKL
ncbi:MAG: DNA mismatch repair protein MutS [Bacteroidetes bacterium]|nr:DNA mismatch repair protein MutS [Bacteroidota bacterium]